MREPQENGMISYMVDNEIISLEKRVCKIRDSHLCRRRQRPVTKKLIRQVEGLNCDFQRVLYLCEEVNVDGVCQEKGGISNDNFHRFVGKLRFIRMEIDRLFGACIFALENHPVR